MIHPVLSIGVVLQQHKNENLPPRERQSDEEQIGAEGEEKQAHRGCEIHPSER